ncbi:MAG TPA: MMPL family transporter [Thermoanaerobaculia bacterium]|nr:MMPL family transporter [Thermoanaerobaculia bacterium]
MTDRILDALAKLCLRHSKLIAIVSLVVGLGALAAASRIHFDPEILNLIPENNRNVNEFRKVLRDMGTLDSHVIVLNMPAGRDVGEYETLISAIAEGYRASPRIADVNYRIPNPLDLVDVILPRAMLFLDPSELPAVAEKLSDEGIRESVARNRAILQTPQSLALKQLIQFDPFNLSQLFMRKFQSASGGFQIDASSGYYLSADRSTLLILTKPKQAAQQVDFAKALLNEGSLIEARALSQFRRTAPPGTPIPSIEHTGGYRIAVSDADLIRRDVIVNVLTSVVGVLAIFLWGFRRPASLFYAGAPLILALAMTFGIAGIVYGTLSSASAGFAALLAGLGIDFIMVLYGRYVDERNRGATMPHAIVLAIRSTVPGVVIAAVTTAATFYAFLSTDFRGMSQLGFLTGTGVLFFLGAVVFLLPALIVLSERGERKRAPKLFHHSFGADRIMDVAVRHPKATLVAWLVFTLICGALATRLRFSDNVQDLRAKGNEGVLNQEKITKKFGQSFEFMMYVIQNPSLDHVVTRTHAITNELDTLVPSGVIASHQSIASFVPPREQQMKVVTELQAGRAGRFDFDRISRTFRQELQSNGFRPTAYDDYLPLFASALAASEPMTMDNLDSPEMLEFASRFMKQVNGNWMSVIYIYPAGGRWPRDVPPQLLALNDLRQEEILTGINLVSGTLRQIVKADATRATILAVAVVAVLLFLSFRSLKAVLLVFTPLTAGCIGMFGLMAVLNLEFNFMNVFVGLMLVGVATDYALYMIQRHRENPAAFNQAGHETAKAVAMAALTTIVGYGSFMTSHYPGLRSIGYASTFGVGLSGLAAITLIPAILMLGKRTNDRQNPDDPARTE